MKGYVITIVIPDNEHYVIKEPRGLPWQRFF